VSAVPRVVIQALHRTWRAEVHGTHRTTYDHFEAGYLAGQTDGHQQVVEALRLLAEQHAAISREFLEDGLSGNATLARACHSIVAAAVEDMGKHQAGEANGNHGSPEHGRVG
jgi:hypothetical protein